MLAILSLALTFTIHGCASTAHDDLSPQESESAARGENVVTRWATIASDAILRPVESSTALRTPGQSVTLHAMVQLAVHDVAAAFGGDFAAFSISLRARNASRDAAVATAAYRVLRTRVPGRAEFLDQKYAETMATVRSGPSREAGVALGEQVAAHYLELRANDGLDADLPYVQPPPGPGVFEPTAATPPVDVKLQLVPGYTITNAQKARFFPAGPRALASAEYGAAWTEVRDYGRSDSTIRSAAQKDIALFWSEQTYRHWARNLIQLAVDERLGWRRSARLLAMALTASADAVVTGFTAKYHFLSWRPLHAIPRADTDGNDATTADPTWTPLLNVNHPEYPSAHAFWSWALLDAVRAFFGTNHVRWTFTTVGVTGLVQTSRTYDTLSSIGAEVENARVWAGLHYRFATDDGRAMGRRIAAHTLVAFGEACDDD
jgi:hypothetical protein